MITPLPQTNLPPRKGKLFLYWNNETNSHTYLNRKQIYQRIKKYDTSPIQYVVEPDENMCIKAVRKVSIDISKCRNQTEKLCLIAVKEYARALNYILNPTEKVCLAAVQKDGRVLEYVKNQTNEICKTAIMRNPEAIKYVQEQTIYLCILALDQNKSDRLLVPHIKLVFSFIRIVDNPDHDTTYKNLLNKKMMIEMMGGANG